MRVPRPWYRHAQVRVRRTTRAPTSGGAAAEGTGRVSQTLRGRFRILPRVTRRPLTLALLLALAATTGHADDLAGSRFTFGAFGTVGAVYQNARGLAYRRSVSQGHGARAGELDPGTDSLLGLQVTGGVASTLELQGQPFCAATRRGCGGRSWSEPSRATARIPR